MKFLCTLLLLLLSVTPSVAAQRNESVNLQGQVVCCAECWAEADRKTVPYGTPEDLEKAVGCVTSGDPTLLAVENPQGDWTLYELQLGKFKRTGKNWLEYVGKHISVTGIARSNKGKHSIKVDALSVLSSSELSGAPAAIVTGTEVELTLKDLFGAEQRLTSMKGRIVVLNFWATYCLPCRKEMPDLAAIQNEFGALGVQVIGAAADQISDQSKVMQFIKDTKVNFPIWLGATARDMQRFGLGSALPGTVIIGRDGKVLAQIKGVIKREDLKKQLEVLLAADAKHSKEHIASAKKAGGRSSSVPS
jgi:thiol-disulfide isomerase/thioredoxin